MPPCCMDWRCRRTEPDPYSGLCDADVFRASQLQHSVQHVGRDGHVWTTASVQGKKGRSATGSGAVMCPASTDAVRMTAGHDEFHGSGPNHLAAHSVPWPSRVFPIPALPDSHHLTLRPRTWGPPPAEPVGSSRLGNGIGVSIDLAWSVPTRRCA